ncbi:acyl-CoA desaturase [Ralstonia sp. NFACC01]|jgi:linoleoyl-CoA desaturase|uniref:acyl-CoA desaturase n=1 Tax=Ralstonia sp. NFACC01 TaxID=1566294 RepID=UPI0008EA3E0A|nr:acyl-CoA desaturase [Ralstonia sp. NFACC01]SFP60211.1 linoleoyl-CoA desaturase [Ralstonia sp. NFACC01]
MPNLVKLRYASPRSSSLAEDLRQAAHDHLQANGDHRFADARLIAKGAFLVVVSALLYVAMVTAKSTMIFVLAYVAFPFIAMLLAMNVLHDGAHRALSPWPWLDRLMTRVTAIPLGIEPAYWAVRHVHYHHAHANVEHYDLDTAANRFLRQTPFQPWYPQFRYQHRYWPLIAALSLPYINWIYDWSDRLGLTPLTTDRVLPGLRGWATFLSAKTLHLLIAVAVPAWVAHQLGLGWGWVAFSYFAGQMLASCVLVALILGTHWADVTFYLPPESGQLPHTWHEHAFHTACDWQPQPAWIGYWLGGLNWHLTHHLFPTYSHRHYPALAARVAKVARSHALDYRALTYRELLAAQQMFLRAMGKRPD